MPHEYNRDLIPRAQEMRGSMTPQEQHLWFGFLRSYPVRFKRQAVIYHYIADFYCDKAKLVIEVDGAQHAKPDATFPVRFAGAVLGSTKFPLASPSPICYNA